MSKRLCMTIDNDVRDVMMMIPNDDGAGVALIRTIGYSLCNCSVLLGACLYGNDRVNRGLTSASGALLEFAQQMSSAKTQVVSL